MIKNFTTFLLTLIVLYIPFNSFSQKKFPQSEFINPLNIPIELAGSFAECRPNHFHTGIDLKTNNKENLPVKAAADGYISRISISHSGYGNCLYVTHPNGYTTVYGHLNNFAPTLMQYLNKKQYELKKWNIDIDLPIDSFKFKQGEIIAFSGNTGGSTAPHLHFEIRDTKTEVVYNPLFFGFNILDNIAPKAKQLAFYNGASFYNFKPIFFNLTPVANNNYTTNTITLPYSKVNVGVDVEDFVNGSNNWLGVKSLKLFVNDKLITDIYFEQINFKQNRAINAYADFGTFKKRNTWFHGLYRLKNNPLEVYKSIKNNGTIDISDGKINHLKIILTDAFNNSSTITSALQYENNGNTDYACKGIFVAGKKHYYMNYSRNIYTIIPENCLYDDLCVDIKEYLNPNGYSNKFSFFNENIPSHSYFTLGLKVKKKISEKLKEKLVFVHKISNANLPGSNSQEAQAATYQNGYAVAEVRTMGNYWLALDTIAPNIKKVLLNSKSIVLNVVDNFTKVKNFNVYINDQWACFSRKGNQYYYEFKNGDPKQKVNIKAIAEDDNGNINIQQFTINR